jgi:Fe-S cluster biogenesis protein NfuA
MQRRVALAASRSADESFGHAIKQRLSRGVGDIMLVESEQVGQAATAESERLRLIKEVIEEIRPNLRRDGGDCELVEICGNKVMVKLTGACVFCKLSSATLEGIQSRIVEKLGEFVRLVPVMGGVKAAH